MHARIVLLAIVLLFTATAFAQLAIQDEALAEAVPGQLYHYEFHPSGGDRPYRWSLRGGKLPPGISLDAPTGTLSGIPTDSGDYRFTIVLTDSSGHAVRRGYVLRVRMGTTITIDWIRPPEVTNGGIYGEVEVANAGREVFDLTFICVAVNEIGRATALGYQRFNLGPGKQRIPFGVTLPRGTYVVHADAVGEIARTLTIRRARLQSQPLVIP